VAPSVGNRGSEAVAGRLAARPLALAALALVAADAAFALAGLDAALLSLAALLLAPGLALVPLLPKRISAAPVAALAAAPALGFATIATALISLSSAGVQLDGTSVRITLAALVLAGLALPGDEPPRFERADAFAALGLGGALVAGYVLQREVIGDTPVPGNDWAKYVLYGDEIRNHGALLIDNPLWMLGAPFREDPAAPAVEGAYLILAGGPAGVLVHGIWVAALAGIASVYAFVRAWWGRLAGVLAALFVAVLPISQDILAWHGLANAAALALLPLVLAYAATLASEGVGAREAAGFALVLVGLAAAHRLSLAVGVLAVVLLLAIALFGGEARRVLRGLGLTAAFAIPLGAGVAYDLVERQRTFGGTQGYDAYLSAKVRLGPVAGDLTIVFTVLAVAALAIALRRVRRDRALLAPLSLLAVTVALAFGWIAHVPLPYFRMAYFLPIALVTLVAVGLTTLLPARRAALAGALACAAIAVFAWVQTSNVRDFYGFANAASLRGLDAVAADLRPREAVVTDRCWSFLSTWLLHTPTIAALEPEDIQPEAELRRAREARAVLDGTPAGLRYARSLGVRYLIVDPTCTDSRERPTRPPEAGTPVFLSRRLVVLRLPGA
jgi:hypothetical protein